MFNIKKSYYLLGFSFLLCLSLSRIGFSQETIDIQLTEDQKEFILKAPIQKIEDSLNNSFNSGQYALLFLYSKEYLERGIQENNDQIKYTANYYIADHYFYNQPPDYKTSLLYINAALEASQSIEIYKTVRSSNFQGNILYELGKYQDALESYLRSLKLARENELLVSEIVSKMSIGNVKLRLKDFEEGKQTYSQILELLTQKKYRKQYNSSPKQYNETYVNALNGLGICQRDSQENKLAIMTFINGLLYLEEREINSNKEILKATIQNNLGKAYSNIGVDEDAEKYFNESNDIFLRTKNTSNAYFQNVFFQAEFQVKRGDLQQALETLEAGFKRLPKDQYPPGLLEMYDLAISISQTLGDIQKENTYGAQRRKVTDDIHTNDIETRALENKELSEENEELTSENITTTTSLKSTLRLVGVLLVLLLLIVIFYFRSITLNKRKFDALILKMNSTSNEEKPPHSSYTITDEKTKVILQKLEKLENAHFFIHINCTLHSTAKKLKTNTTYLSKIINTHKQKSFNEYLNELRIGYALQQIKENTQFRNYTISAIAKELGYKSANTFTNAFKKQTGINPSFYIKQIEKSIPA